MATPQYFIHNLSQDHLVQHNKQHHRRVLLSSFHLNGHTIGFHLQTRKFGLLDRSRNAFVKETDSFEDFQVQRFFFFEKKYLNVFSVSSSTQTNSTLISTFLQLFSNEGLIVLKDTINSIFYEKLFQAEKKTRNSSTYIISFILNKTEKKFVSKTSFKAAFSHFNVQFTQFKNIGCTMQI